MLKYALAALACGVPTLALAQNVVAPPGALPPGAAPGARPVIVSPVDPGATGSLGGATNSGPGAVDVIPGRTGASTAVDDSAAAGNAEQQTRAVPQFGRNGGNGAAGGSP
ncbi:hypothetical protein [Methylobacterium nonmethylotrophicum]|uniref:Uncharacterized protein n=1 Tax=Methylobacterium nonmethylotrophicum TaxID=1141884 RepID=A0A4Z0NLA4_9HYPH|nr:hypothetical protein [Methylobacterium nonmethylotrophicum]TGD97002.1 hypothetical protein EU555_21770 [Methylobacterium nonmethylotrophicum]